MKRMQEIPYLRFVPILFIAFVMFKIVNQVDFLYTIIRFTINLFIPLIWALVIAYLLNPLLRIVEKYLKVNRVISITLVYLLLLGLMITGITFIVPRIIESITEIVMDIPDYFEQTKIWFNNRIEDFKSLGKLLEQFNINLDQITFEDFQDQLTMVTNTLETFIFGLVSAVFNMTSGMFKFVIGMIISIYILHDKEILKIRTKEFAFAYLGEVKARKLVRFTREVDLVFSKYLIGKLIDSLIIGILCLIGLLALNIRFALLLAIVVGVTNMIPYFGPFIGMIPAVIITVFYSPLSALWVFLFILLLQQFDGYVLGPKILGDSVGLSPLWIILAILVGGGLFGVLGMLLSVPVMAVIRNMSLDYVEKKLKENEIDINV